VTEIFVSHDSAALACGADSVVNAILAQAHGRGASVAIRRNGSRGMVWLEPLVEVQTPRGRIAYGPVSADDVSSLFDAGFLEGGVHPLCHGITEDIDLFSRQCRLTFARVGLTEALSIEDYRRHGGLRGLERALTMAPEALVQEVVDSGLRGRGGAAFPTGIKWNAVRLAAGSQKYIVCNADEGDSGTFSDRMLMEGDPFCLIEGMVIAGIAVGATRGYVYLRSEYPNTIAIFRQALDIARQAGLLGPDVLGSGRAFDLVLRVGAGSYVCGEETALLESLEGKRGVVRAKPPLPAVAGLFGQPTVINNVITLASVPVMIDQGAVAYRDYGVGRSRGTLPVQLAGNVRRGGLFELPFGISLRELIHDFGGGTLSGRPVKAVQVGGPLGAYHPVDQFDTPLDYEAFLALGGTLGHGGVVVFDDTADMLEQARHAMAFCALESCGKCTPCRVGAVRGEELITEMRREGATPERVALLRDLCEVMTAGSLCAMGGMTPYPVLSALDRFPEDFTRTR
jgi:formate dehydrogenase iron-sulfur subunit